uniref:Uncharacterized protein n=1 Tax=Timema monikensis TaxID=170555 RepID=A0A7R9HTC2_9NEOP|nr:unnamed protein product [Timema monikensis]
MNRQIQEETFDMETDDEDKFEEGDEEDTEEDSIYQELESLEEMDIPEEAVEDPGPSESKRTKVSLARDVKEILNMKLSILLDRCKVSDRNATRISIATLEALNLDPPQHMLSKKNLPSTNTPEPALREQQCSHYLAVLPSSPTPFYVRMRTTIKHHVAGTVKRTVPYKDFCIFFINWGMATETQVTDKDIPDTQPYSGVAALLEPGWVHQHWGSLVSLLSDKCADQTFQLGLFRSDYFADSAANFGIKQVEFNTIASSFGGIATNISQYNSYPVVYTVLDWPADDWEIGTQSLVSSTEKVSS